MLFFAAQRGRKAFVGGIAAIALFAAVPEFCGQELTTIDVKGPTVIAFFRHMTEGDMEKDPDMNEALSDFQLYVAQATEPLRRAGINFKVVSGVSFQIRIGKQATVFRSDKIDVGYYFVAPGRKPRVEYGVMTDTDLLQAAKEYFKLK